ncbi:ferric-dicitrate binding protein FerR, regulates iron transport through sigma-19 [Catalinimonas alkaloidigena]|uniref:Ferric-dicitrate binding protein FerR, regulates iron transport through sigma-19 n=1 Tax=Catalinimonas alkaloidigena TaxID=1075417 RepID=A0A1G9EA48_9BACT|nr:FecR domain-containing protein [Catalinimonas alkaloidigena]SDK72895.1 ferric-dicitrate binding protein FerR, regulates iron transport through sigma-19 [Catalinimonas alkaloidigena]
MKYDHYEAEDFAADEAFTAWVQHPEPETERFWQDWLAAHPDKRPTVAQAVQLVRRLRFQNPVVSEPDVQDAWQDVQAQLDSRRRQRTLYRMAAVISFLILSSAATVWVLSNQWERVETAFGETRTLELPDGSRVVLNAHSQLRYPASWDATEDRDVWLEGEAFFDVVHTANHQPFRVHTPELDIRVLGTSFNVRHRRGKTQVALQQGSVQLQLNPEVTPAAAADPIMLVPGDLGQFSDATQRLEKQPVDVAAQAAWKHQLFVFDDTPLSEIALHLKDQWGVDVAFADPVTEERRLTGEIQAPSLDVFLESLEEVLDLEIQREQNRLLIQ